MNRIFALIVAGGEGKRFSSTFPKVYCPFNKKTVLYHAIKPFADHPEILGVGIVIHPKDNNLFQKATQGLDFCFVIPGGKERQDSVFEGLKALKKFNPSHVLIHDGARPFISSCLIDKTIESLKIHDAVLPLVPISETVKVIKNNYIEKTLNRETLRRAQTPQGFCFKTLLTLHKHYKGANLTDDTLLFEKENKPIGWVEGEETNIKITYPNELRDSMLIKTATGFDVHALIPGKGITLFGVFIPCEYSLRGHSDADVGLHAITDALLGTAALQDIGHHFPDKDSKWKGANSTIFLKDAYDKILKKGGAINHIDATLIGEIPKLSPYRESMRSYISNALQLSLDQVSIKATTTETLGFTGRKEGLAVMATVTVAF